MAGYSQAALARRLGLSFQQIQKYEKGVNRIGAGRLYRMARVFEVPVSFFYEGLPVDSDVSSSEADGGGAKDLTARIRLPEQRRARIAVLRLVRGFLEIPDEDTQDAILNFVAGVAQASASPQDRHRRVSDHS